MKKLLILMILTINIFALNELSAISKDNKEMLDTVLSKLHLEATSTKNKIEIYESFSFALKRDWYAKWWHNDTAKYSKIENSDTQFLELTIVDENRVHSFTFIHFQKNKQITLLTREYISTDSSTLLEKFKKLKNDKDYKLVNETNNYAILKEKEYMDDVIINIKNDLGMISYIGMEVIDL